MTNDELGGTDIWLPWIANGKAGSPTSDQLSSDSGFSPSRGVRGVCAGPVE